MVRAFVYLFILLASGIVSYFATNDKVISIGLGLFSSAIFLLPDILLTTNHRLWLAFLTKVVYRKEHIRFSISYLYRIKVDGKYLLVKGLRIQDQYQPVGGVFKRFSDSNSFFRKHSILDDEHMPIDNISKDDLRVLVPAPQVLAFLNWFNSEKEREVTPLREFSEELVKTDILSSKHFASINPKYVTTVETKLSYSEHFQCKEILIAKIYEVVLTIKQEKELRALQEVDSPNYIWVDALTIRRKGYVKAKPVRISETAKWII